MLVVRAWLPVVRVDGEVAEYNPADVCRNFDTIKRIKFPKRSSSIPILTLTCFKELQNSGMGEQGGRGRAGKSLRKNVNLKKSLLFH